MKIRRKHIIAFSLVELLVVIAIMVLLGGISSSAIVGLQQKANTAKCASNLRQIGVAALLYFSDHNNETPVIEPWPSNPVYSSSDGAQTINQALGTYGISQEVLQCPSDLHSSTNYYAIEGSSYQWFPMANGQNTQSIKQLGMGNMNTINLSSLFLAFDYASVHNSCSNVLFGDGHVTATGN